MFVSELFLRGFRGAREMKSSLRLSKFNVLIGRNNSGKSIILHSLFLLPHPHTLGGYGRFRERRDFYISFLAGGFDSLIYRYSGEAVIDFAASGRKYRISLPEGEAQNPETGEKFTDIYEASKYFMGREVTPGECERFALLIPNNTNALNSMFLTIADKWSEVAEKGVHTTIVREVINPAVEDDLTEILKIDKAVRMGKKIEGELFHLSVRDLGDGVERILIALTFIELCEPSILLWDDFEVSLHPDLLKSVLLWLCEKDRQIVLATHSIDVLRQLAEIKPKDAQVIKVEKSPDDILSHRTLTIEELTDALGRGEDPRFVR